MNGSGAECEALDPRVQVKNQYFWGQNILTSLYDVPCELQRPTLCYF